MSMEVSGLLKGHRIPLTRSGINENDRHISSLSFSGKYLTLEDQAFIAPGSYVE